MNDTKLFGQKEIFAIEIGNTKTKMMFKLRFWVRNRKIGSFTKSGELSFSVQELNRFIDNKEHFYLDIFDSLDPAGIYDYITGIGLALKGKVRNNKVFEERKFFYLLFGMQFNTVSSGILLLYKQSEVIFLLPREGHFVIDQERIPFEDFLNVVQEYTKFYQNEILVR
jgi:hypothetical protein